MHDYNFVIQGVNLRVRVSRAAEDSPTAVLLHGFPESWYGWRNQILPLYEAGWRVAVPDLRGFGDSGKPAGKDAYRLDVVAADAIGILDKLGVARGALIGHDLGAAAAWRAAQDAPDRVSYLVAIDGPHPGVARPNGSGLPLSTMRLFPILHEANLRGLNFTQLAKDFEHHLSPNRLTVEDLKIYRESWYREGAIGAMLKYFQASPPPVAKSDRILCPSLVIWGQKDSWYPRAIGEASAKAAGSRFLELPTDHYPHLDAPDEVTRALIEFLGRHEKRREWRPPQW
jgi:pimeloyl-ACP methyl ester carboxylesterase